MVGMWVIVFVFGTCIGSFLNMCAYRMPRDLSLAYSRSRCSRCGFVVAWYDNIPILSCTLLMAKCRRCLVQFSWSHLYVEVFMGLVALWIFATYGITPESMYSFILASILVLISLIDIEFRIIPDELSFGGLAIGLFVAAIFSYFHQHWFVTVHDAFWGALVGGGSLWTVGWIYEKLTGKEGMGFGDVKLLAMMGAHVGPQGVLTIVFISSFLGSLVGLSLIVLNKMNSKSPIPFGPFLCAAFSLVWFFKAELLKLCKVCMPLIL